MFCFSFSDLLLRDLGRTVIGEFQAPKEAFLDLWLNQRGVQARKEAAYHGHADRAELAGVQAVCEEIVRAVEERVHRRVVEFSRT